MPASPVERASKMRSNVNRLIKPDAKNAPANACRAGTPTTIIGGPIMIVRAIVQPTNRMPAPLSFSSTFAAVVYVGNDG